MIPTVTAVRMSGARDRAERPLLVLGPSLGTSAATLWAACAAGLADHLDVLAWDLPGHGHNTARSDGDLDEGFTMAELAAGVLRVVDDVCAERADAGFHVAGDSVGGAVSLQLALDAPDRVRSLAVLCSGARIGTAESWAERIETVASSGTSALVSASAERWFGPGFLEREPDRGSALLHALADATDRGYAHVCAALARFDVRDRLAEVAVPVLAVAGSADVATPPATVREVADGVPDGRYVELPGVAHLAPAEAPDEVARLLRSHVLGELEEPAADGRYDAGLAVRREVLGDDHVDRALAATTDLTADFQRLITEYAWGSVWTRPGLARRDRSIVTLTALVARGHHEELAMHLRAARRNGLSLEEIGEVLLQTAIYCGVPDANTAFRIAAEVFSDDPGKWTP
jgi:3-oxoadipate enol-lactonase/4-carboxymuconolactone decarboxylase